MTARDSEDGRPASGENPHSDTRPLLVAVTGATGSAYGLTLTRLLLESGIPVRLCFTRAAERVIPGETGKTAGQWAAEFEVKARSLAVAFALDSVDDIGASGASGSFRTRGMAIAPCSMGTLARIAAGVSGNLIEREADVCLKERRPLVLLARETPLSAIHLRNMLSLTEAGAVVMPPVPAFYARPKSVDDVVNDTVHRVLDLLGLAPQNAYRWGETGAASGSRAREGAE